MIKYKTGDILLADEDIICHQVNCQGVMGHGLALQIKNKFPMVFEAYYDLCSDYEVKDFFGKIQCVEYENGKYVANIFAQNFYGTDKQYTDYQALETALVSLFNAVTNLDKYKYKTIAMPFNMGCGLGGGDWTMVEGMIEQLSSSFNCDVTIYKLDKS